MRRATEDTLALLGGAVLGAVAMYLLDPEAGERRRENLADATGDALRGTGEALTPAWERAREMGQSLAERTSDVASRLADSTEGARHSSGKALRGWGEHLGDLGGRLTDHARGLGRDIADRTPDAIRHPTSLFAKEEESHATAYTVTGLATLVAGAGAMFLLDPQRGRQRRAVAQSKIASLLGDTGRAFRSTGRYCQDLMNRTRGTAYKARARLQGETVAPDTLVQRVRSDMGRAVSHPSAIQVMASADGTVTLTGRVLASEIDSLLSTIHSVRGVNQVINRLEVRDTVQGVIGSS